MSFTAFDQLKSLYDLELYSNVTSLANLILTVSEHDADLLNSATKYQTYIYYGDSLFHIGQFQKAESIYKQALEFKKTALKSKKKNKQNHSAFKNLMSDTELKYQMYLCLMKLNHNDKVMELLQSIPRKERNAKINMALAKLYHQFGLEKTAIRAYKEVLKEWPMAVEAAEGLLNLGVSGADVGSLIVKANNAGMDWYTGWLKAQECLHKKNYTLAITTYKQLEEHGTLRGNPNLLLHLGEAYHYIGDSRNAIITLTRAHTRDPTMQRGLDVLAALLANEKRTIELERLIPEHWCSSEFGVEAWIALAYYSYAKGQFIVGFHFAEKAVRMNHRSVEALIVKGVILYDLEKYEFAASTFSKAIEIANYRFEPYRGLVMCYKKLKSFQEAVTIGSNAYTQLGDVPRVLTLYASALMKQPETVDEAKSLLEKALELDEAHLPAVYFLCEILEQRLDLVPLIDLLNKYIELNPTPLLHNMLGDIYTNHWEYTKAVAHYYSALRLDPTDELAIEGVKLTETALHDVWVGSYKRYFRRDPILHNSYSDEELEDPYEDLLT